MLGANREAWYVSLERHPSITVARFGHLSRSTGHQIWDEVPWPMFIGSVTESHILGELYTATLDFWQTRR